jgi:hypothetical protein
MAPLKLHLDMGRREIPLGGEVRFALRLQNEGSAPVEVASLYDNNIITNYVLFDAEGNQLAVLNHLTRQELLGRVETRTGDVSIMTLDPGAEQRREDNLCRYTWFERPGVYFIEGLYRWEQHEIRTAREKVEILAAPLCAYDQQWSYHYGEKFLLHSVWVAKRPDGVYEAFLRESIRSRPQVINFNGSMGELPIVIAPRVSFNRSLIAGGSVWFAWLGEKTVTARRTLDGRKVAPPREHTVGLSDLDWAAPPLTSDAGDVFLFLSGLEDGFGRKVIALQLDADGNELQRKLVTPVLAGVGAIHGVCDEDGGFHLFWATGDTFEVKHLALDLATLTPVGPATTLWRAESAPLGIFTPPVLTADTFVSCFFQREGDPGRPALAWLALAPAENPLKIGEVSLPAAEPILRSVGEMNAAGHVFVVITTPKRILYLNGSLMQMKALGSPADLFAEAGPRTTVTDRNDVYLVANRRPFGLSETLIQAGTSEDLSENAEGTL